MKKRTKKDIVGKWIENLRSGKFTQTRGTLKNDKGYCCLGVLVQDICSVPPVRSYTHGNFEFTLDTDSGTYPTMKCRNSLGGLLGGLTGLPTVLEGELVKANDQRMLSFDEIADLIVIAAMDPEVFTDY